MLVVNIFLFDGCFWEKDIVNGLREKVFRFYMVWKKKIIFLFWKKFLLKNWEIKLYIKCLGFIWIVINSVVVC